ncbi:MAG: methylamine utilization protein [Alphaproteobacteria bacterium]|nr:methylamine utilization protein [Alphaproteobacteria bacterium]
MPAAAGAELTVLVSDADGRPVADAVVTLAPRSPEATVVAAHAPALPPRVVIDQRNETFIPYVQIVPRGGEVAFSNSDQTRHHVYSFSPVKAFEFVLAPGESSAPVRLERIGVVAVGCNIHDRMVAYLYVTDQPWAAQTDSQGRAVFHDLAEGSYMLHSWHPRLRPGRPEPTQPVELAGAPGQAAVRLALLREQQHQMDHERARY